MKVAVILLAGGIGSRFNSAIPKQFCLLGTQPVALYSFKLFLNMPEVEQLIVVCEAHYRQLFVSDREIQFALPGKRRQDSLGNGLKLVKEECELVSVHDAARPNLQEQQVRLAFDKASKTGAAALGVAVKATIKRCDSTGKVLETLPREQLVELQTPQVIQTALLKSALHYVNANAIEVTDDLALVEAFGQEVYVVPGDYKNIKITTPEDLALASLWMFPK